MQGPQGTPAEKTVASVTFIKNSHCLRTRLSKDCPHLLEVVDVRKFLTLVNEYFDSEMRQVTETPIVLDRAMNFVEAAKETLKRITWPGYICFSREKQHYGLSSQFSIKHEDLLPVSKEPTTFRNKEDIKRLNDWRNESGRGVRQQSAQNSFTKDKAGTLPFYMYTLADANDSTEEQALTSIQELFKAVSSEKEADTLMYPTDNNCRSDVEPVPCLDMITRRINHHILKFTQSNANPTFSPSSFYVR